MSTQTIVTPTENEAQLASAVTFDGPLADGAYALEDEVFEQPEVKDRGFFVRAAEKLGRWSNQYAEHKLSSPHWTDLRP